MLFLLSFTRGFSSLFSFLLGALSSEPNLKRFSGELDSELHSGSQLDRSARYSVSGSDALNCSRPYNYQNSDPSIGLPAGERSLTHQPLLDGGKPSGAGLRLLAGYSPLELLPIESIPR
jgi:hypothetical protein